MFIGQNKTSLKSSAGMELRTWEWVRAPGESGLRPTEKPQAPLTCKGLAQDEELSKETEKK